MPYADGLMFARALTARERTFLGRYFGASLDLNRVSVSVALGARSWSPYGSHIRISRRLLGPGREVCLEDPRAASILAHEAVHVWQRQHGRAVSRQGAVLQTLYTLRLHNPYLYDRSVTDPDGLLSLFLSANIEQQGQIFQDYVHAELTGRCSARFAAVAAYVRQVPLDGRLP